MNEEIIGEIVKLAEELSKELTNLDPVANLYSIQLEIDMRIGKRMYEMRDEMRDEMRNGESS